MYSLCIFYVSLRRVCLVLPSEVSFPSPLEVQKIDVSEKVMRFLTLDLKKKLMTSETIFMRETHLQKLV